MKNLILALLLFLITSSLWASCEGTTTNYKISDPIDNTEWNFTAQVYFPKLYVDKTYPAVFVLPTIVGETPLEKFVAHNICRNGMVAYVLNIVKTIPFEEQVTNLHIHDDLYVRALASLRHIIGTLKADPKLSGNYGIIGSSQGGMITAFLAGSEPLLKTSVIIAGAGNVPGVLAHSDQNMIQKQRSARMEQRGITSQEDYQEILKDLVPHDPISVAKNIKPGSAFLFIGTKDTTVPTKYQRELQAEIANPKIIELRATHLETIFKANSIHLKKIMHFLSERLK